MPGSEQPPEGNESPNHSQRWYTTFFRSNTPEKFHLVIKFFFHLFTLQCIQWCPNISKSSKIIKVTQGIVFILFFLICLLNLFILNYTLVSKGLCQDEANLIGEYLITLALSLVFFLIYISSLAFLFIYSGILTEYKVIFKCWRLEWKCESICSCILGNSAYFLTFILLIVTIAWKFILDNSVALIHQKCLVICIGLIL